MVRILTLISSYHSLFFASTNKVETLRSKIQYRIQRPTFLHGMQLFCSGHCRGSRLFRTSLSFLVAGNTNNRIGLYVPFIFEPNKFCLVPKTEGKLVNSIVYEICQINIHFSPLCTKSQFLLPVK